MVLVGRCWEAGGAPPYWPWVQALRSYVREADRDSLRALVGADGGELANVVPELRELVPGVPSSPLQSSPEGARFRLFESVSSFLRGVASGQAVALVLDDLHAADEGSLLLLRFVGADLAEAPLLIAGAIATPSSEPEIRSRSRCPSSPASTRCGGSLGGSRRSRRGLVARARRGGAAGEARSRRPRADRGEPAVRGRGRAPALRGGAPDLGPAWEVLLPIPQGVKEAIARRVKGESDPCRQVLTLAAALGREFSPSILEQASGLKPTSFWM